MQPPEGPGGGREGNQGLLSPPPHSVALIATARLAWLGPPSSSSPSSPPHPAFPQRSLCEPSSRRSNSQSGERVSSAITAARARQRLFPPPLSLLLLLLTPLTQTHETSCPAPALHAGKWRRRGSAWPPAGGGTRRPAAPPRGQPLHSPAPPSPRWRP